MWTDTDKPDKNQSLEQPTFPGRKKARRPLLSLRKKKRYVFPMVMLYLCFGDALNIKKSCSEHGGHDRYSITNPLNANDFATANLTSKIIRLLKNGWIVCPKEKWKEKKTAPFIKASGHSSVRVDKITFTRGTCRPSSPTLCGLRQSICSVFSTRERAGRLPLSDAKFKIWFYSASGQDPCLCLLLSGPL